MTVEIARQTLRCGGSFVRMYEAVATLTMSQSHADWDDWHLWFALFAPGVVAEQAMFALYKLNGRPLPEDRTKLVSDPAQWARWLVESRGLPTSLIDPHSELDVLLRQVKASLDRAAAPVDPDPTSTSEWIQSLAGVVEQEGPGRAEYLLGRMIDWAQDHGIAAHRVQPREISSGPRPKVEDLLEGPQDQDPWAALIATGTIVIPRPEAPTREHN